MSLSNSGWENIAKSEGLSMGSASGRTALVADNNCNVYRIVTNTSNTPSDFRKAIQEYFEIIDGADKGYIGIFLDGSGSSQLKCKDSSGKEIEISGDRRYLARIIILEDKN